ncbi:anti-virulence regulator CigR family protein [Pseudomonas gingeri]|uniref:RcnB family protein n=1 Tax=Pseudomonas gingeri TaxID=117681 RepID=A0A7Y7YC66_9PSED|nr:anti-virulence regulator CigR family protein [Pseudomonas gingeri]NWA04032.1 RcnB family protein [Pseudomonas gingeri]NWA15876.1 RcnB family protein [Pseudomonas gingeri]NWA55987.1 RcnB family protein [Pseudomonas gingeri]NWA95970.1 RcnB family protein [Pseudomonas gingeri]NWB00357.1 RcnB family protein [Pseudomonas gingeri]
MKMPKRLVAGLGVLMLGASSLLQAAPQDDGRGPDHDRGGYGQQQGRGPDRGPGEQNWRRPPQDFGPVRQIIHDDREHFTRGAPPPPGIRVMRGQPLPHGYYGERLDPRAVARLPVYHGYEWRRVGGDVALIEVGTGIVYEVLNSVLY